MILGADHLLYGPMLLAALLAFMVVVQFAWSAAVILQPNEAMYEEAVIYDQVTRVLRGEPLYQPLDRAAYAVTAYDPLYYWLAAGLRAVFGPGFGPGRILSFVAGLTAAGLVASLTTRRAGTRWAGAFAALLFLALGLPAPYLWSALYRVDLLGIALSLGAIAALIGGTTPRRLVFAGVLAGLAILTKQTLIAAELAGTVWLWRRDRGRAMLFAGAALTIALGACTALEITTGAFLANAVLANVNPFRLQTLIGNLAVLGLFQAGPLAVAVLHVVNRARAGRASADELLLSYWIAALVPLIGLAKVGAAQNYWIEFAAATAVLGTLGTWARLGRPAARLYRGRAVVPMVLLGATVIAVIRLVSAPALPGLGRLSWPPSDAEEFGSVIERVRSEPGEVLAEPLDVVALADRPILLEPYIFSILHREGRWDARPLVHRICSGEVHLLVLGRRLEDGDQESDGFTRWPAPVFAALRQTMVLEAEQAGRFLYAPQHRSPGCGT